MTQLVVLSGLMMRHRRLLVSKSERQRNIIRLALCGGIVFITLLASFLIGATGKGIPILVGLFSILAGVVIASRPQVGVYILVVFVFLNLSDVLEVSFGIPSTNKPLVALIFISTLASHLIIQRKPLVFRSLELFILGYGLAMVMSSFFATDPVLAGNAVEDWFKDFAIIFIIVQVAREARVWRRMQWAVVLAAAFVSLLSTYQNLTGNTANTFWGLANAPVHQIVEDFDSTRVTGPLDDPNLYAQTLLMVLPIAAYRAMTEQKRWMRWLALGCCALMVLTVIFTYSRGAFLALLVTTLLIVRDQRWNPYKILGGTVLVVVLVLPILPASYLDRILTLFNILPQDVSLQTELSFRGRTSELIVGVQMFADHPLIGVGVANYPVHYLDYSTRLGIDNRLQDRQAHSLLVEIAAESGAIGLFAFVAMLMVIFAGLRKAKRQFASIQRTDLVHWTTGIQLGLISYQITSLFLHGDWMRYWWLMVGFAASCTAVAETLSHHHQQRQDTALQEVLFTRESVQIKHTILGAKR